MLVKVPLLLAVGLRNYFPCISRRRTGAAGRSKGTDLESSGRCQLAAPPTSDGTACSWAVAMLETHVILAISPVHFFLLWEGGCRFDEPLFNRAPIWLNSVF